MNRSEANADLSASSVEKLKAEKQELYDRLILASDQNGVVMEAKVRLVNALSWTRVEWPFSMPSH